MAHANLICLVFAFVCFVISAFVAAEPYRWRLIPAGLAFLTLSFFVGGLNLASG